ncbi:hypothetical protein L7F22_043874 [Adiantum nelumboides]|nr:hypothetical protein [Adiantum nelumboides]
MNAFPAELIQHHYACMLVAGLLPPQQRPQLPTTQSSSRIATNETERGVSEVVTSSESSARDVTQIAANATAGPSQPQPTQSNSEHASEKFPTLSKDLCEIFSSRGRSTAWDPAKANSATFHTVLVDHNVRLPPRKTRPSVRTLTATPPEKQNLGANLPPRSPLSPLHPSSPLFPDGLIAPIWLRKHRELVPSIFVAFHCLAEHAMPIPPPTPPKEKNVEGESITEQKQETKQTPQMTPGLSGPELKAKDEELIRIIAERKRSLSERGIKLTVVLLTTRAMLESSTLEQRLSFIRRSSQLDSKASLFVLTPVSRSELGEFVTSLQSALFDHAMDYYREQFRRVRRKRQKYPPPSSTVTQIMSVAAELRGSPIKDQPLSKEGWLARCDYKMGAFAEFGGNLDEALTYYTNAYQVLCNELLTSTMLLPPRTKRWAEAKVLADTLSFRISKLLLYRDNGEGAWDHFRTHLKKFIELSQGWGIGEMTFEFWSWLGKQYKLMGDLLDLAMREIPGSTFPPFRPSTHFPPMPTILLHPLHLPMPTASGNVAASYNPHHGNLAAPNEAAMASYAVPAEMCPGAGECFYIAGVCALERWERYKRLQSEQDQQANGNASDVKQNESWSTVNITQESKVDHSGHAIEALTRAHEVFKRQRRHRLSLFVASKIANAYIDANQDELALRFLERTVKSYQFENWSGPLCSQLLLALESARKIGDADSEGKALWKLLSKGSALTESQYVLALEQVKDWIANRELAQDKRPAKLEFGKTNGPLCINVVFGRTNISLDGQPVPFQVQISAHECRGLEGISFDRLSIHIRDEEDDSVQMIVHHQEDADLSPSLTMIGSLDLGTLQKGSEQRAGQAGLTWPKGQVSVFQGSLIAKHIGLLQISNVVLEKDGKAPFLLDFNTGNVEEEEHGDIVQPVWFSGAKKLKVLHLPFTHNQDGLGVQRKKHNLKIDVQHQPEAYLDEHFIFTVKVSNEDSIPLACSLDAHILGPPGEVLNSDEVWSDTDVSGTKLSSLRDVFLGKIAPNESIQQVIYAKFKKHLATRTIDLVLHSKSDDEKEGDESDSSEIITSKSLPILPIFSSAYYAQWRLLRDADLKESQTTPKEISTASIGADDVTHITAIAALNVSVSVLARQAIRLHKISLVLDNESRHLRIWGSNGSQSIEKSSTEVTGSWMMDDKWGGVYDIEMLSENAAGMPIEGEDASLRPTGKLFVEWQRESESTKNRNISALSLPLLLPPHLLSRLIVSLPSSTSIEQPLVMLITIVNPSRLAADIFINIDDSFSDFIIQSHRSFTVPNLMPRSTRSVPIHVAPLRFLHQKGAAAVRTLPRIRAWQRDRRQSALASTSSNPVAASARSSIDSAGVSATGTNQLSANKQDELLQIVNQRPGAGVPLEVLLRYTSKTAGGVGTTAAGAAIALPNAAMGANQLGGGLMNSDENTQGQTTNTTIDVAAHLQAETQRTGLWTIFVH